MSRDSASVAIGALLLSSSPEPVSPSSASALAPLLAAPALAPAAPIVPVVRPARARANTVTQADYVAPDRGLLRARAAEMAAERGDVRDAGAARDLSSGPKMPTPMPVPVPVHTSPRAPRAFTDPNAPHAPALPPARSQTDPYAHPAYPASSVPRALNAAAPPPALVRPAPAGYATPPTAGAGVRRPPRPTLQMPELPPPSTPISPLLAAPPSLTHSLRSPASSLASPSSHSHSHGHADLVPPAYGHDGQKRADSFASAAADSDNASIVGYDIMREKRALFRGGEEDIMTPFSPRLPGPRPRARATAPGRPDTVMDFWKRFSVSAKMGKGESDWLQSQKRKAAWWRRPKVLIPLLIVLLAAAALIIFLVIYLTHSSSTTTTG
ncbi:hypothetical protein Q5752_007049 [Cryptotrichosporon argae]